MTALLAAIVALLALICLLLIAFGVAALLAWRTVSVYLTWNTRYQAAEYEQAVNAPQARKPALAPSKLTKNGRTLKKQDDLVDLADIDWETGYKVLEDIANGA